MRPCGGPDVHRQRLRRVLRADRPLQPEHDQLPVDSGLPEELRVLHLKRRRTARDAEKRDFMVVSHRGGISSRGFLDVDGGEPKEKTQCLLYITLAHILCILDKVEFPIYMIHLPRYPGYD